MSPIQHPLWGIFYMCAAMFMYTSASALLKTVGGAYGIFIIVFARNFFALLPLYFIMKGAKQSFAFKNLPTHGIRALGGVISHTCLFSSILLLPFGDAYALSFASTLVVCVLSVWFLKEKMNLPHWIAVFVGFLGVILIAKPSGDVNTLGVICALVSVMFESVLMIHSRPFSKIENPARIVFFYSAFSATFALVGAAVMTFGMDHPFVLPTLNDGIKLAIFGIGGGMGQYFITQAYAKAEARVVAPFIYTAMVWSMVYAVFLFSETVSTTLLMGSLLIVGSGLYILMTQKNPRGNNAPREKMKEVNADV